MLKLDIKKLRKFISPLLSKKSVTTSEIDQFNEATQEYLDELEKQCVAKQSEPNIVSNALKPYFENLSYVAQSYSQEGQSGMDLALMLEHSPSVIIEAKVFESSAMITKSDINKKSLHEAILYFMRERNLGNNKIYHIIITDFYNWFVFDAKDFDRLFWQNKTFKKIFESVKDPSVLGDRTEDFYTMASEQIEQMKENLVDDKIIECAYFDLREKRSQKQNIALYKLLSQNTLLKTFNPNDANTLNRVFYSELLYILGLEEQSNKGKKLISRAKAEHSGALYENITQKLIQYGKPTDFESVIRLMIIWVNRILFLKLLESQLIKWNSSEAFSFLNKEKIKDFDQLEMLFFDILAKKPHERGHREFDYIPYLNSSLFEPHAFEQKLLTIATLQDDCNMPYFKKTVLKDIHNNRKEGEVNMLHYLFEFLDAYDFSSEGSEELVTESKSLINASVLGLIFEKLNGYKDGSFYTPSFITMYMSKETITKAIIEKFNQAKGWSCKSLKELDDKIEDKKEANAIIDSLTICDPAVGSGHFLVSSLNTILEIKSQLRILFDAEGRRVKDYELSVENDELIVRDDEGEIFEYKRGFKEGTRIQKMLFLEKQKIIENSLFGVDINPNSAHITRLRLWIELLKNSYYAEDTHLVTMPNIDINIKVGNSLISRYGLDDEIDIPNIKHAIERYKASVKEYKEGNFLSSKEEIRSAIDEVKGMFGLTLKAQWKQTEEYKKNLGKYVKEFGMDGLTRDMQLDALEYNFGYHGNLFDEELSVKQKKEKAKLFERVTKAAKAIEEIEKGKIYEDAFEWRFEFPEVLDEEGNFVGFDVVIGNPPYVFAREHFSSQEKDYFTSNYELSSYQLNLYVLFIEKALSILKHKGKFAYIVPNNWLTINSAKSVREFVLGFSNISIINFMNKVFEDANVDTSILMLEKSRLNLQTTLYESKQSSDFDLIIQLENKKLLDSKNTLINISSFRQDSTSAIMHKVESNVKTLSQVSDVKAGLQAYELGKGNPTQTKIMKRDRVYHSKTKYDDTYIPYLDGKNVSRYVLSWNGEYLKYGDNLAAPRKYELFSTPRILVRQIPSRPPYSIHACFTDDIVLNDRNSMNILNIRVNPLYLLALLNSKLITFWFIHKFGKLQRGIFPQFKINELKEFPIAITDNEQPFIVLVAQILQAKKEGKDTTELETQIDKMVYDLYGLSEDEVAIVEGREVSNDSEIGYNNPKEE